VRFAPGPEVVLVGEAGHVADLDEQACCPGRADAVQAHQRGPSGLDQGGELLVRGLLALIDALEVSDQIGRDAAAGLAGDVAGADRGE